MWKYLPLLRLLSGICFCYQQYLPGDGLLGGLSTWIQVSHSRKVDTLEWMRSVAMLLLGEGRQIGIS